MQILPARRGDEQGIASVHVGAWQAAYRGIVADSLLDSMTVADRATRWAQVLEDPACTLLVAKEHGEVLGFVSFGRHRGESGCATHAEIWTMYVAPQAWRRGVGAALMREATCTLASRAFSQVWVWVLAENTQARRFYESCGFVLQPDTHRLFKLGDQELAEVALLRNAD